MPPVHRRLPVLRARLAGELEEKRHADTTNGGHANAEDRAREMEHNERMRRIQEEKVAAAERARAAEVAADEAIARAREQENAHDAMTTEHGNVEMEMDYFDIEEFNKQRKRKRKMEEKEKMQNGAHARSKNGLTYIQFGCTKELKGGMVFFLYHDVSMRRTTDSDDEVI